MEISPLAGKPAPKNMLVDLARLEREYYERQPDLGDLDQMVSFGTSGHRWSSLRGTFTEAHILAATQAAVGKTLVSSSLIHRVAHLKVILDEARQIVNNALDSTGSKARGQQ